MSEIDDYITQISKLLPYPMQKKSTLLEGVRKDVKDAMDDSNETNPSVAFGSPLEVAKNLSEAQDWGIEPASWTRRFFATLIDVVITGTLSVILFLPGTIFILSLFVPPEDVLEWVFSDPFTIGIGFQISFSTSSNNGAPQLSGVEAFVFLILFALLISITNLIYIGYYIVLEKVFFGTIGKKIVRIFVVDETGIIITWKQAIIRNFTKILFWNIILVFDTIFGILMNKKLATENIKNQRMLDILAETIVIKQK
ncbi:MAG: RDD family protein [Candidatus Hermodarchaeota archaeon]